MVDLSLHTLHPYLLYAGAGIITMSSLVTDGPLALVHLVPRKAHAAADTGLAILLAAGPLLPALRPDLVGLLALELAMVAWLRISTLTRYSEREPRLVGHRGQRPDAPDASRSASIEPTQSARPDGERARATSGGSLYRALGRATAQSSGALARGSERALLRGARLAGRSAAAVRARRTRP